MKKLYLALLLCCSSISYSQEYGADFPNANVNQAISNDTATYSFLSNYLIDEYKAPMLEKRMLGRYSEIIEIHIDYQSQVVTFKILKLNSELFLENFIKHFRYKGYEIN